MSSSHQQAGASQPVESNDSPARPSSSFGQPDGIPLGSGVFSTAVGRATARLAPAAILAVAFFLRFYRLAEVPKGLLFDEAYNGLDVQAILAGARPVFLDGNFGREALFIYLQAASVALLGRTDFALRIVAAIIGLLTIAVSYLLVRRLFGARVALLATAWLAVSPWHVIFSRIGLRSVSLPLFASAAFYCFWRGYERAEASDRPGASRWLAAAGAVAGLTLYTYTAARFVPLVFLAFFMYLIFWRRSAARAVLPGLVMAAAIGLAVFAPEAIHFLRHPDAFSTRVGNVSIFNPELNFGSPLAGLKYSATQYARMLFFEGDHFWDRNIAGRPIFDPLSAGLLVLGLGLTAWRWKRPTNAFLLVWLAVMSLPALMAVKDVPNFLRATGLIPALFVLPALGADWLWTIWSRRGPFWRAQAPALALTVAFIVGSALTYRSYFGTWAKAPEVAKVFNADVWLAIEAARARAATGETTYLASGEIDGAMLQYGLDGVVAPGTVILFDGSRSLILPPAPLTGEYLFPASRTPDAGALALAFPGQAGEIVGQASNLTVRRFHLDASRPAFVPGHPLEARFGESLQLLGHDYPRDVLAGDELDVVWYWRLLRPEALDLAFFNQLFGQDGQRRGQLDGRAFEPNGWPAGTIGVSTYHVRVDSHAQTGAYWLDVGVYDRANLARLPVVDSAGRQASDHLRIGPIKVHGQPAPAAPPTHLLGVSFDDNIDLLGYDLDHATAVAGDSIRLTLHWSARGRPVTDYTVFVHLTDSAGKLRAQADSPPAAGSNPTSVWDADEAIADAHELRIPADAPPGEYRLVVGMYEPSTGRRLAVTAGSASAPADTVSLPGPRVEIAGK